MTDSHKHNILLSKCKQPNIISHENNKQKPQEQRS